MNPLPDVLPIEPLTAPVDATVPVPGSKSYTNRALLVAALARGESTLTGALFSDDTHHMSAALSRLGIPVEADEASCRYRLEGRSGAIPAESAQLFVGNAGTACRFLVAMLCLGRGVYVVDGVPRMRERPIGPLLAALRELGGDARSLAGNDCPPVEVRASGLLGGSVRMPGGQSSQYFSALLMIGPCTPAGVRLEVEGPLVSRPYVDLTADVMASFGVTTRNEDYQVLESPGNQAYAGRVYPIPPDASNASYFFAAAALTGGRVRVDGLGASSLQGDMEVLEILEEMGCRVRRDDGSVTVTGPSQLRGVDRDMSACSDMAQTVAALAPFAAGTTRLRNLAHIRHQETDRLAAMAVELRRLGQSVREFPDGLEIEPRPLLAATIQTYDDHRMAMAFSLVGLRAAGIAVANPACVRKTFPGYFELLEGLRDPPSS